MAVEIGKKGRAETVVTEDQTASAVGSGLLPVFATPMMAALMEKAAVNAIQEELAEGESSVGTYLELSHDSATPVGMKVWAEAEVTAVDGRAVAFTVSAFDQAGPIGVGVHRRFIIRNERFLAKARSKGRP